MASTVEEKAAFAIHVTLFSILASWRKTKADHVVACFEGRSWRKDFYKPYKANREVSRSAASEQEKEEMTAYFNALDSLREFLTNDTNVTVLQNPVLEADDLIAGWIQHHQDDQHVIISSDTVYYQLLSENVSQYNGITDELHTISGIYDRNEKLVIDKKTKLPKTIPNPSYILFEKCVRGDSSDNVFSAYPGARTKGTKNKVGILEAFADMDKKGFDWNNFMLTRWVDHNEVEHRVLDDYHRNKILIDLSAQPENIRNVIDSTIASVDQKNTQVIGVKFIKFCGKYELNKIKTMANEFSEMFSKKYEKPA